MAGRHRKPDPQVLTSDQILDQMAVPAGYPATPEAIGADQPDPADVAAIDSTDFPEANPLA